MRILSIHDLRPNGHTGPVEKEGEPNRHDAPAKPVEKDFAKIVARIISPVTTFFNVFGRDSLNLFG